MEEFGYVDYKKPLGKKQDLRTSTYRGNVYVNDVMLGNKLHARHRETRHYTIDTELAKRRISIYKSSYIWKYGDPDEVRNPSLDRKVQFIKPYDECQLRFIERPMRPATSVAHQDYLWRPEAPKEAVTPLPVRSAVDTTKIMIDRAKPGFAKFLDPSASTSRLAFVAYSPEQVMGGIAAKDNITFWNWDTIQSKSKRVMRERDETMCEKVPAKQCPKRRCEFPSLVKPVPHAGMTTEVRSNYVEPYKRAMDYDVSHIRNKLVDFPIIPFAKKTEYKMIGSGERTQRFV